MTESGKSTLAKKLAAHYRANGVKVGVLDPLCDPSWNADFQTNKVADFLDVFWQSEKCAFFVDEAAESVGRYDDVMISTATRGRHWGHRVHYISQRGALLNRTVRDQCPHLFLFTTALSDCKILAAEYNKPGLLGACDLPKGNYFHCGRFTPLARGKLW
jgi:hypothetical protein